MEGQIITGVLVIVSFLSISVFFSTVFKKLNFPYTIGLVLVGAFLGFLSYKFSIFEIFQHITLSPDIILYIILPALIFDAAINIDFKMLYKNLVPITLLALPGLLISAGIVGLGVSFLTSLPFIAALVFGALISATDPVAVIALFKEIGAPKRLITLVDGESLFNDATAIVLFSIVMSAAGSSGASVSLLLAVWKFISVLLGGVLVGGVVGVVGSFINNLEKNDMILQITISLIVAYVSFVVSNFIFDFSGVMATLTAGIIMSSSIEKTVKRSNIETMGDFWEYFSFIANSIIFILLGLTEFNIMKVNISQSEVIEFLYVIPVVLAARVIGIYILVPMYNYFTRKDSKKRITNSYKAILFWGGLRGAVPVALVLAIPDSFPHLTLIIHFTLSYILFTLLIQGTTIKRFMNRLGIKPDSGLFEDREVRNISYTFKGDGLGRLIMQKLRDLFDDEGFFIKEKRSEGVFKYLLQRHGILFQIALEYNKITVSSEPKDILYFKTVLYEALLELDSSLEEIKLTVNSENLKKIMESGADSTENSGSGFNVLHYLSRDRMLLDLKEESKENIIRELVEHLVKVNAIPYEQFNVILQEVIDREKSMTTALGKGIAIPHSRSRFVNRMIVLIALVPRGIDFKAMDGKPVKILILIISPRNDTGPHLQMIAALTGIFSENRSLEEILRSTSTEEIYRYIEGKSVKSVKIKKQKA